MSKHTAERVLARLAEKIKELGGQASSATHNT